MRYAAARGEIFSGGREATGAAGTPKIYRAGGFAIFEPGISESERKLVARWPRDNSLAGCINPRAPYAEKFVTAYNREMVALKIERLPDEASTSGNQR
jgi:hypothetical protein